MKTLHSSSHHHRSSSSSCTAPDPGSVQCIVVHVLLSRKEQEVECVLYRTYSRLWCGILEEHKYLSCCRTVCSHCCLGREAQSFPHKLSCYEKKPVFLFPAGVSAQPGSLSWSRSASCPFLLWAALQTLKSDPVFTLLLLQG